MEYITIDGDQIPALGFGTGGMRQDDAKQAVSDALALGYRHIDTAQTYGSEGPVGAAVADSDVDRENIFVTTKLDTDNLRRDDVLSSVDESLDRLEMEYVDLLLIHGPNDAVPIEETIDAMNQLQNEGTVQHIGVSNFSVSQMETAIDASATPIRTNQVEYHPFHDQTKILDFCIGHDLLLTAYSPLDGGDIQQNEPLAEIGDRYGKTPAQVTLRWLIQQPNVMTIPRSANQEHQQANIDIFDFELTSDEVRQIFELEIGFTERLNAELFHDEFN